MDKNVVINNYVGTLAGYTSQLMDIVSALGDNPIINDGVIKSAYTIIPAISAQITLIQNALDNYNE